MNTKETAIAFAAMLKDGKHIEAAAQFNAPDIASFEAMEGPMAACHGAEAVKAKSDWWYANHEVHSAETDGPLINGDRFLMRFSMDITSKMTGQRLQMDEMGLYTVRNGKIVEERFFYAMG